MLTKGLKLNNENSIHLSNFRPMNSRFQFFVLEHRAIRSIAITSGLCSLLNSMISSAHEVKWSHRTVR